MIGSYPLRWPVGQPRTPVERRTVSAFKVDFGRSRDDTFRSLSLMSGQHIVLTSNMMLRQDGIPLARQSEPTDPGIALYFDRGKERRSYVIACDTYQKARWNLRAIGATVDALRSIQRHGATSLLEQMFSGFAQLPLKTDERRPWWEVLEVTPTASPDEIQIAYRKLSMLHHPDRGGDPRVMTAINLARDEALASR